MTKKICEYLQEKDFCYFLNVVLQDVLLIYYRDFHNEEERKLYERARKSPYRNYVYGDVPEEGIPVYFLLVLKNEDADEVEQELRQMEGAEELLFLRDRSETPPEYCHLKIYHKNATKEYMVRRLLESVSGMGNRKVVAFGGNKRYFPLRTGQTCLMLPQTQHRRQRLLPIISSGDTMGTAWCEPFCICMNHCLGKKSRPDAEKKKENRKNDTRLEYIFLREELLLGEEALEKLRSARVALFGIGGVGSFAAEALARGGVGHITLVDGNTVSITNINRQLIALHSTVGKEKTAVMAERIADISQACSETYPVVYGAENRDLLDFSTCDYVIDAIDTVTSKFMISREEAFSKAGVPVISCMGTGNKFHPERFEVTDISKTSVCPLAKVMRKELKVRGIKNVKVVYSKEEPQKPAASTETGKRQIPGSLSFVPPVAGLLLAGEVIRHIAGITD